MENEKAKEILDFLARRIGFARFKIDDFGHRYIAAIDSCHMFGTFCHLLKDSMFIDTSSPDSYAEVLENMLEASREGYAIEALSMTTSMTFLPAYCSLEQIEIEMDLESIEK